MPAAAAYLENLNPEQRRAVEHGVRRVTRPACAAAGHRRRRLGQDQHARPSRRPSDRQRRRSAPHPADDVLAPRRRRDDAAASSASRARCMGDNAGVMTDALTWAGTFHGIGARLLREYAEQIGLDPAFTIHDREDSADLMNLVRHELGFSQDRKPLSRPRAPASRSIRAASTPRRRLERGAADASSRGAPAGRPSCASCSPPMSRPSSARTCSITTTCCSTGRR